MITERQLEQLPDDAPTMALDPIVRVVELDARIRVAIDVRRLAKGDARHDEPGVDELQAYLLAMIKGYLDVQPWIGNVRVSWLDVDKGLVVDITD